MVVPCQGYMYSPQSQQEFCRRRDGSELYLPGDVTAKLCLHTWRSVAGRNLPSRRQRRLLQSRTPRAFGANSWKRGNADGVGSSSARCLVGAATISFSTSLYFSLSLSRALRAPRACSPSLSLTSHVKATCARHGVETQHTPLREVVARQHVGSEPCSLKGCRR